MRSQINSATTIPTQPTTDEARIPIHEQDLDLGRSGVIGLDPDPYLEGSYHAMRMQ
jgi:hypothetical protein